MFNHTTYFRNVAINLKELQHREDAPHFSRITSIDLLEEFLQQLRVMEGFQLVVLDDVTTRLDDSSKSDNLMDKSHHTFFLLEYSENNDFDSLEEVRTQTKIVVKKILGKMFHDKRNYLNGLANLDRNSIVIDSIGPLATGYYGHMVTLSILDPSDISYNPNDWINE